MKIVERVESLARNLFRTCYTFWQDAITNETIIAERIGSVLKRMNEEGKNQKTIERGGWENINDQHSKLNVQGEGDLKFQASCSK